jgi:hypothetical protein
VRHPCADLCIWELRGRPSKAAIWATPPQRPSRRAVDREAVAYTVARPSRPAAWFWFALDFRSFTFHLSMGDSVACSLSLAFLCRTNQWIPSDIFWFPSSIRFLSRWILPS